MTPLTFKRLPCTRCGALQRVTSDVVQVLCGSCTARRVVKNEILEEDRLAHIPAESCKALREEKGWTQAELAHRAGIPACRVSEFERGVAICPPELESMLEAE